MFGRLGGVNSTAVEKDGTPGFHLEEDDLVLAQQTHKQIPDEQGFPCRRYSDVRLQVTRIGVR